MSPVSITKYKKIETTFIMLFPILISTISYTMPDINSCIISIKKDGKIPALIIGRNRVEQYSYFPELTFPADCGPIYISKYCSEEEKVDVLLDFDDFASVNQILDNSLMFIWFDYSVFKFFQRALGNIAEYFSILSKKLVKGGKIYLPLICSTMMLEELDYSYLDRMVHSIENGNVHFSEVASTFKFRLASFIFPKSYFHVSMAFNKEIIRGDLKSELTLLHRQYVKTTIIRSVSAYFSDVNYINDADYVFVSKFMYGNGKKMNLPAGYFVMTK